MARQKRRKRRNPSNRTTGVGNQPFVHKQAHTEIYCEADSGIPLKKERQTLSHEEDFLNILILSFKDKPVDPTTGTLTDHVPITLQNKAEYVINDWDCDWEAIEAHHTNLDDEYGHKTWDYKCAEIYNNFSYKRMGLICLYEGVYTDPKGRMKQSLFLQDGNHRSLSLACLLLQEKIKWQPLPYWLWSIPDNVKVTVNHSQVQSRA